MQHARKESIRGENRFFLCMKTTPKRTFPFLKDTYLYGIRELV